MVLSLVDITKKTKTVARGGARTHDPGIKSPMLYRLSYPGICLAENTNTLKTNINDSETTCHLSTNLLGYMYDSHSLERVDRRKSSKLVLSTI